MHSSGQHCIQGATICLSIGHSLVSEFSGDEEDEDWTRELLKRRHEILWVAKEFVGGRGMGEESP